ncbi:amino acid permease [Streptomyces carpinensis]|uniref:Amino acid permease n=1 Tax=Streptomyces carpinensis TaxID=66369 RepID=A0ABV1W3V6_9ACTN|nr:amino acid permease [Streptomyces carpinensis]
MGTIPDDTTPLRAGLKQRHLTMISLGGVIGAGLFIGSSAIIHEAGPGAFITYGLTGLLVLLVMRQLGEMAAARPSTGSFTDYARMALGPWAGFSTGWLYWYFWVIVVGFEAVVGGQMINKWLPGLPVWLIALGLLVIMTAINLMSVGSFGEAEYWFAGIKVAAIIVFILLAGLFVLGLWPGAELSFANLTEHGGFFPNGLAPVLSGVVVVIFSMTGVEVVTVAAAESKEPGNAIRKAVSSVVFRILGFFVLSTFLIVVIRPWSAITPGESPFVAALDGIGIPAAADILNAVVLVAVLSCLNSGLYTASRMLFVLGGRGDAPRWMTAVNRRGVPVKGLLSCTVVGYGCVMLSALWPDTVFLFLINASGAVFLFVYLLISLSQLRMRKRLEAETPGGLTFKMWLHPFLPVLVALAIAAVLISMGVRSESRIELLQGVVVWALMSAIYAVRKRFGPSHGKPSNGEPNDNPTHGRSKPSAAASH